MFKEGEGNSGKGEEELWNRRNQGAEGVVTEVAS